MKTEILTSFDDRSQHKRPNWHLTYFRVLLLVMIVNTTKQEIPSTPTFYGNEFAKELKNTETLSSYHNQIMLLSAK